MQPKRSLGQNFFTNQSQAIKIVEHTLSLSPRHIIEIGPGTGSFTQLFAAKQNAIINEVELPITATKQDKITKQNITTKQDISVIAIEKDDQLFNQLCSIFPKVKIIHADFLDLDLEKLATELNIDYSTTVFYGSLPYNISKRIIEKVIHETKAMAYYFIVQKEVAEKYCATPPNNNPLAISTNLFATPKLIMTIKPESFTPRPNVMSALIRFIPHSEKYLRKIKLSTKI
jgi:16S rRNA (adenine1518-N6/adenine1519-N6)-dimethyltransferase